MIRQGEVLYSRQACTSAPRQALDGFARILRQLFERLLLLIEVNQAYALIMPVLAARIAHIQAKEID
ncbi:MAG: hypothetical protein ACI9W6_002705 [Motiliproteus sp.]|jgi:hypothetical protein